MVRVQAGDEAALAELLDRYRARLHSFLTRRAGDAVAEDLFQETWIRVVRAKHRFDPKRRFSTWMYQIANNLCRDRARRREVEGRYRDQVMQDALHDPARRAPPALAERLDMRARVDALPDRLREVVVLRYFQELPEADIAEAVGIPRGTVKSRLHAAIRALRAQEAEAGIEAS